MREITDRLLDSLRNSVDHAEEGVSLGRRLIVSIEESKAQGAELEDRQVKMIHMLGTGLSADGQAIINEAAQYDEDIPAPDMDSVILSLLNELL